MGQRNFRFECQRSGNCCKRAGVVYFSPTDIRRAADYLEMTPREFRREYLTRENGHWLLAGLPGEGCPFYYENSCLIHPAKPLQCQAWPFWPEMVSSPSHWRAAAKWCPGIGKGHAHDPREVKRLAREVEKLTNGDLS